MTESPAAKPFERLIHRFAPGATLLRMWELSGGFSAHMTALEIEHGAGPGAPTRTQKVIVRRHGAVDLARNPHIAADEFRLLQFLRAAGMPAPEPLYVDESGEISPTPCIIVAYIEGGPAPALSQTSGLLEQLAAQLAAIHQLTDGQHDLSFLPEQQENIAGKLRMRPVSSDEAPDERRIRDTLQAVWPLPPRNPSVLLHGDFWPGNTLWRDGRLVAVIDWEDAALGDPLADLAISRLDVVWAFGSDAMLAFTQAYQSMNPLNFTDLPYWDQCAALRQLSAISGWGLDAVTDRTLRARLRLFIDQAFEQLAAGQRPPVDPPRVPGRGGTAALDSRGVPPAVRPPC
jgi:aminoglycoside phosphotransferase (APT) family kinase protein